MPITITVPDRVIKDVLQGILECDVYDTYSKETLRRASLSSKSQLVNQIFSDPKFQTALARSIKNYAIDPDMMWDMARESMPKFYEKFIRGLDQIADELDQEEAREFEERYGQEDND